MAWADAAGARAVPVRTVQRGQRYPMSVMQGVVSGTDGQPVANVQVEVWHVNHLGNYSFFSKSQSAFNLRRTIVHRRAGPLQVPQRDAGGL
jgi:protocatechuate 3,4-dioxygenase beta subunit